MLSVHINYNLNDYLKYIDPFKVKNKNFVFKLKG